jgi:2-desacetyl-2-hydroxyethyl bacteriochlorophyllide A dehydrogenase
MGHTITLTAPKQIHLQEYADPPLEPLQVRILTLYSGISAGTELAFYRGTNPYLNKRWDAETRMFVEGASTLEYPVTNLGYEEVGEIVELGSAVTRLKPGQRIWGTWGHRSTHVAAEEWAAARILAPALDVRCGIFSHVGAIALNVVLDADIHVGEYVAVFGQGVMGLTVLQLARLNGGTTIAVDGIADRLALAQRCGADHVVNFREQDPAQVIKALTGNRGADVSIEITGAYSALQTAIQSTAYNSRVVAAGFFQGGGEGLYLGEEFHHNRIQIVSSQISGSAPRLQHRWDRLRLNQTVMDLQTQGRLKLTQLITHTFPAREAAEAFHLLDSGAPEVMQVVLDFSK